MPEIVTPELSTNLGFELPNASVSARRLIDIQRIKTALVQLDTFAANVASKSEVVSQSQIDASIGISIDDLKDNVPVDGNTLAKLRSLIGSIDATVGVLVDDLSNAETTIVSLSSGKTAMEAAIDSLETNVAAMQTLLQSDDTTLDTFQEIVNRVKTDSATLTSLSALSGPTNSVTQVLTNKTIQNAVITNGYTEETFVGNTGPAIIISLANGSLQFLTLNDNTSLVFPDLEQGKSFTLFLKQDGTGSRTVTWPGTVAWPGGTTPTMTSTANKSDKFVFVCDGSKWFGSVAGQNY